jgi:ribosomal protein S18 acetylase RimI-like enzyme
MNDRAQALYRDATSNDLDAIIEFQLRMAEETEQISLDQPTLHAGVSRVLGDLSLGRYYVAEIEGLVVGSLLITYEWSDWRNGNFWWIQSVYVLPEARRLGVFRTLFAHLEQLARSDATVCGIRLYVERENTLAQATYRHCGLADAGYVVMEVDYSAAVQAARGNDHA